MPALLAPRVLQLRDFLQERREEIGSLHTAGASSLEVVAAFSDLVDQVVLRLVGAASETLDPVRAENWQSGMALVALAGYGRRELAPYSDVDLLFLFQPSWRTAAEQMCGQLVRDFWDIGLVLGWSLRTPAECLSLAGGDISIHTSLMEARHVGGDAQLTEQLREQLRRLTRGSRASAFITRTVAERKAEQLKYGSTVYLLEPDLKKSKGGLREFHLLRWIGHAKYDTGELAELVAKGALSAPDAAVVARTREFLFQVRNDLHFRAGRAQDVMTLEEQVRLAVSFGYVDRPGLRAVEQFMQQYYRHCSALDEVVERFVNRSRGRSPLRRLFDVLTTKHLGHDYWLTSRGNGLAIATQPETLRTLQGIVELFARANEHGAMVTNGVREQVRVALSQIEGTETSGACRSFWEMLAAPGHLNRTLHDMHTLGVLERIIPEFAHARGLIQFNQYHKYTIDEHTLLCVANTEALLSDQGLFGQVYRGIRQKQLLHLTLLLHDLGKGFDRDHSDLGRDIAEKTATRFGLKPHEREVVVFLVHQHLVMAHLAFRRDTSDDQVLREFARKVGTPEILKMLFILTAADITSVGPGTWTSWKAEMLSGLYLRTLEKLTDTVTGVDADQRAQEKRDQITRALSTRVPEDWPRKHLATMRRQYLLSTPLERILEHLRVIHTLRPNTVETTAEHDAKTKITSYTIYTFETITHGLFSKIAGVLAAKGLQILSAQIVTLEDGIVVDRFEVIDPDLAEGFHPSRQNEIAEALRQVLSGKQTVEGLFQRRYQLGSSKPPATHREPVKVDIDNDTSDDFTIVEVFAHDLQGLLYVIARTLWELGLSVTVAKISTSLDQVLDVFYVTGQKGNKIAEEPQLEVIKYGLVSAIEAFESEPGA